MSDGLVARVALLTAAVEQPLSYAVPDSLTRSIAPGSAVVVPLQSRSVPGIVVELGDDATARATRPLKLIASQLDPEPALNRAQLALARWISAEYFAPLGRACALMVPPGFTPRTSYVYERATRPGAPRTAPRTADAALEHEILGMLEQRGPLLEGRLRRLLPRRAGLRAALRRLVESGEVTRASTLEAPRGAPVRSTLVQLIVSTSTMEAVCEGLELDATPRTRAAVARRVAALRFLGAQRGIAWADWLTAETGATRADLHALADRNVILLGDAERWRDPLRDVDYVAKTAPPLTGDQERAWDAIRAAMDAQLSRDAMLDADRTPDQTRNHFLLRGVTGSGKTEIYMRAVERALQAGGGAIILVPEISLTPQTSRRFLERFPGKVALVHSRLSAGERYDTWRKIRSGQLSVVVGARSALFAPLPDPKLIVFDEEHDASYKQGSVPYYDARRAATEYARATGATLIFGSATPSLEAMYRVGDGAARRAAVDSADRATVEPPLTLLELPNRVRGHANRVADQAARLGVRPQTLPETEAVVYQPLPDVQVVDMRAELRGGNVSAFSGAMRTALAETLARGEQAILFLNRRGTASCVLCRDCGDVLRCPNDDTPLTLHTLGGKPGGAAASSILKCHQCNHSEAVPAACPSCGRPRIRFIGVGTQKIEQTLHEEFPAARVVRWDRDTASARSSADQMLQRFVEGSANVLVGTQMIAKGLDLPRVTLVGVVLADVGLFLPDFRASERVFQLIAQVAGRAGRGILRGRVIVQTYNPEHPAISFSRSHDVLGFDRFELRQRQQLRLPPYSRLLRIEVADESAEHARQQCEKIARQLRRRLGADAPPIIGPAQAYFTRRNKQYRWQLIVRLDPVRGPSPQEALEGLTRPPGAIVDVDPVSVL